MTEIKANTADEMVAIIKALNLQPTQPFVCPVCRGNGLVDNGFYSQTTGMWATSSTQPEQCRTCGGRGIVWR